MKAVLFYDAGEEYEKDIKVREFQSPDNMIKFINDNKIGSSLIAAYEFYKEIEIEEFEKVINYRIK